MKGAMVSPNTSDNEKKTKITHKIKHKGKDIMVSFDVPHKEKKK